MKGQTIISGNFLILPFLTGLTLMTTACFTIVTDDARRSGQSTNFIPRSSDIADGSPVSGPPTPDRANDHTYELELVVDPIDAAEFKVTPGPNGRGAYLAGTTVTIDVLRHPGWEIEQWVGPVHAVTDNVAKVNMEKDQTVLVRMVKSDPVVVPAVTPGPTPTRSP